MHRDLILAQLAGLVLEIFGVLLMAHAYLAPARGALGKLRLLLAALFGAPTVDGAEITYQAGFSRESYRGVLRGLALIGAGFAVQAVALLFALLSA
jgi:hypothetical protein